MKHLVIAILLLGTVLAGSPAQSQESPPPEVREVLRLLENPGVCSWLEQAADAETGRTSTRPAPRRPTLDQRVEAVRSHLRAVASAIPRLPDELRGALGRLNDEMWERGPLAILLLIVGFVAFGYGSEQLYWRATSRLRTRIIALSAEDARERLRLIGLRLAFGLSLVGVFGLGSVGAFLIFEWPAMLRQIVLAYFSATVLFRLVLILSRVVLAPGGQGLEQPDRYRIVPMPTEHARFWHRRFALAAGYYAFGSATAEILEPLGFSPETRMAAVDLLGLGLLAIALEKIWRRPASEMAPSIAREGRRTSTVSALLSACGVILWVLWVAGLTGIFWLAVVALALPKTIKVIDRAVAHVLRPPAGISATAPRGTIEVSLERGLRALLIAGAVVLLAHAWQIDLIGLTDRETLAIGLVRGALAGVVILLGADFLWQVIKAMIDRRLAEAVEPAEPGTAMAIRQARLRTLLPIFRNFFFIVIMAMAGLMALSALGVEIGPLIAGAGVVGVAVGFRARTLVKDIISGIFCLLDDAFRVGEYIQSGSFKGTVESFSLRSVKLRHHRGPVFTVPFGQLGAVQNMSRDWVIDMFMIGVTYGTDLEKARKLIKAIGKDLAADPELGRHIIEPLKMQGVEQFGDYAIQIRLKITTKPGEQFVIRRKAYAQIKKAFDDNGIRFAFPTVQVAGGEESAPATARAALDNLRVEAASAA